MKEEWRCFTNACGVQSVVLDGALRTPTLSVDSLATLLHPRPGSMLTLVKDQDRFYWTMLRVMEMNQALINVITVVGLNLIITVIITMTSE